LSKKTDDAKRNMGFWRLLSSDIKQVTRCESSAAHKACALLLNLGFHAVLLYRVSKWLSEHSLRAIAVVISYFSAILTGAQISHGAKIGKGFVVYHPQGIVIGYTSIIGERCHLTSGVVIGQRHGGGDRPCIGDDFYAGTGAKILGRIFIGDSVKVGANSVVLDSIPSGATVVGNPARIVKMQTPVYHGYSFQSKNIDSTMDEFLVVHHQ